MPNLVISRAKSLGFICQYQEPKSWLILPQQAKQRWKLQQLEDRWILSVRDIPQINLTTEQAIDFILMQSRKLVIPVFSTV
ncbi:MAG: hypothetical protein AAGE84_16285 [Cyanobacteria bacterium P01_G01_bin.39]